MSSALENNFPFSSKILFHFIGLAASNLSKNVKFFPFAVLNKIHSKSPPKSLSFSQNKSMTRQDWTIPKR